MREKFGVDGGGCGFGLGAGLVSEGAWLYAGGVAKREMGSVLVSEWLCVNGRGRGFRLGAWLSYKGAHLDE